MPRSKLYGKPNQLKRTFDDIASGRNRGNYPALEALFKPKHDQGHFDPDSICTEDCPNRVRGQQANGLIVDVVTPSGERLAVVEHRIDELKENFDDHRAESVRAGATFATKAELKVIDKHIDRDIAPAIDKLASRSTLKTAALVVSIIGLLVSMAYNVINLYKTFHI